MRRISALLSLLFLLVICAGPAGAHSTKGRVKAPLTKPAITVDDVAYFVESYVYRDLYAGIEGGNDQRFTVKDFVSLHQEGDHAHIDFTVLDKKENRSFSERMTIQRRVDGTWDYVREPGEPPVQVFTFAKKGAMTPQQERVAIFISGCIGAGVLLLVLRSRRKRREWQSDTVAAAPGGAAAVGAVDEADDTDRPDTAGRA